MYMCMSTGMDIWSVGVEVRESHVSSLSISVKTGFLMFATVHTRMHGPYMPGSSPASTSHFVTGVLGWQTTTLALASHMLRGSGLSKHCTPRHVCSLWLTFNIWFLCCAEEWGLDAIHKCEGLSWIDSQKHSSWYLKPWHILFSQNVSYV